MLREDITKWALKEGTNIKKSVSSQANTRFNAALSNLTNSNTFGISKNIGKDNVFDIFELIENFETTTEHKYTEQQGIGQKPTIVYSGEELKKYSLPVKLHIAYCSPDDIISELEYKAKKQEVFSFYLKGSYIGEYVVNKVISNVIDVIDNTTIYAEITVDLIEYFDGEENPEYTQGVNESLIVKSAGNQITTINTSKTATLKNATGDIFRKLSDTLIKKAARTADGYINSSIWGSF